MERAFSLAGWTIAALLFFWLQGKLIRFEVAAEGPPPAPRDVFCQIDHFEYLAHPLDPECVALLKSKGVLPADYNPATYNPYAARQR